MFQSKKDFYSVEEYLAQEETAEFRSEYFQGEIFAMTGGSANHNRIARNLLIDLSQSFGQAPCEAFINDMRLLVKDNGLYTYPDLMVVCGQLEFLSGRTDTLTNPALIVEVLSKSTEGYDRGAKFELYRALTSLQDYILVDQYKVHVEHFHRLTDDRWILQELKSLSDILQLETISTEIPLEQIYRKVNWDEVDTEPSSP